MGFVGSFTSSPMTDGASQLFKMEMTQKHQRDSWPRYRLSLNNESLTKQKHKNRTMKVHHAPQENKFSRICHALVTKRPR